MIKSNGYKAFRGTMKITPKCAGIDPYELTTDWIYVPKYDCWYGNGSSFPSEVCEVIYDETEQ